MDTHFDCLVIGAGYAGSVAAREMAERGGRRVLVLERRGHVGGNAYDCLDEHGILIHKYGPHIFHTSERRVFDYLSRFTGWRDYQHRVVANVHGRFLPVPFNLASLHMAFPKEKAARLEDKLLSAYSANARVTILSLRENTDPELREVADYVYENVFVHYTMKQWGQTPEEIDPATTARVPVLLSRDDRYFQDPYQGMPLEGYTPLFQRMLDHLRITVELGVDAVNGWRWRTASSAWTASLCRPVIYTGEVDELFSFRFGHLPYRTLDFDFETLEVDRFQPTATVNYTVSEDYTRITEYKQLTGQVVPGRTTIMKEYSRAYTGSPGEIPYYAVISPENNALYGRYRDLAGGFSNLHLLGRLAEYKYYNMDAIALRALTLCDGILEQ